MIAIFTFIFAGILTLASAPPAPLDYALSFLRGFPGPAFRTLQLSTTTIVNHANLVKRVVFPLETLPVSQALAALGHQLFGTVALVVAIAIVRHELHATILWLPVLLIPQLILTLGAAWLVASLGVFLRDLAQGITLILMAWMYLTPIIYPESIVPERYRPFINANPFTALIRSYRRIFLEGLPPDWPSLASFTAIALLLFVLVMVFCQEPKKLCGWI